MMESYRIDRRAMKLDARDAVLHLQGAEILHGRGGLTGLDLHAGLPAGEVDALALVDSQGHALFVRGYGLAILPSRRKNFGSPTGGGGVRVFREGGNGEGKGE